MAFWETLADGHSLGIYDSKEKARNAAAERAHYSIWLGFYHRAHTGGAVFVRCNKIEER